MKHIFLMHDTKRYHDLAEDICEVMKDYDYEIVYKTSVKETQKYIEGCLEPSRFYAVGGDGTLNGIIQPLVHTDHELVLLPFGTGNDFCRMITSKKDPIEVLKQSLAYKTRKVDTVALNEYHYINSACFGVDSIIANHVRDIIQIPLVPQSKSYIVSIMQHIFQYQFDEVTIYSEGKCLYEGSVTLCALNNGQYYGGGFPITSNASIQDGYFDICVVEKVPYAKMPHLLTLLFKRKLDKRKEVHSFRVKEAEVVCGNSCNLDGEEVKCQNYQFKIDPLSLNMVIFK